MTKSSIFMSNLISSPLLNFFVMENDKVDSKKETAQIRDKSEQVHNIAVVDLDGGEGTDLAVQSTAVHIQNIVVSLRQGVAIAILLVLSLLALPSSPTGRGRARPSRGRSTSNLFQAPTKKGHLAVSFLLNTNPNFDTNVRCGILYESASPNKTGFITLSIVAYPTILAPSWILIFLPTHRQCG